MIGQINRTLFTFIDQYTGLSTSVHNIALITVQYLPIIFIILLIYLWIKKGDKHKDIVLYSVYATLLGLIITFIIGFFPQIPFISSKTFSNQIFMLSVAVMMLYFQETLKIGAILLSLEIFGGLSASIYDMSLLLCIIKLFGVAIISTVIIYSIKGKLISLNQIFKLVYLILK